MYFTCAWIYILIKVSICLIHCDAYVWYFSYLWQKIVMKKNVLDAGFNISTLFKESVYLYVSVFAMLTYDVSAIFTEILSCKKCISLVLEYINVNKGKYLSVCFSVHDACILPFSYLCWKIAIKKYLVCA